MKKSIIFLLFILLLPSLVLSVNNAKLNGQKSLAVTELPIDILFTCDLAKAGNSLEVSLYIDLDGDGTISPQEPLLHYFYLTDGVGWIRNPLDPDSDLFGDETGVDSKIQTTISIGMDDVEIPAGMNGIFKLKDEDHSTDQVNFSINATLPPPYISGKVTEKGTGTPLENVIVLADNDDDKTRAGISDVNGDYQISVAEGGWKVLATEFPISTHEPSYTVNVTITGTNSETVNFELDPYTCFVTGKLTKEDSTPVPGILVMVIGSGLFDIGGFGITNEQGEFRIGVKPDTIIVIVNYLFNSSMNDLSNWPENCYAVPSVDTIVVAEGQTVTSDFVFKEYNSFISGKCTVDGAGLAEVEISGITMDLTTFNIMIYETVSGEDGTYTLGVSPGTITILQAEKDGYEVTNPQFGSYQSIQVADGETITDKDFELTPMGGTTSISGTVTYDDGSPAVNVYVAAVNDDETSSQGYLMGYTDNSGYFIFENIIEGSWQIGIYADNQQSEPAMRYFEIEVGTQQTEQNFVLGQGTSVKDNTLGTTPCKFHLSQNFPNPFNPTTSIEFDLPKQTEVSIKIFNANGQLIRTLLNQQLNTGHHTIKWNGLNDKGIKVTSGIYLYRLKADGFNKVMKMIMTK